MLAFLGRSPLQFALSRNATRICPRFRSVAVMHGTAESQTLYIVSTPIGNFGDISDRAASILKGVDIVAAEDTRRAGILLSALRDRGAISGEAEDISRHHRPALLSFHAHNWRTRVPQIIQRLRGGESVAVVSDAGTPCVSDPGAEIVAAAVAAGVRIIPVPGACAAIAGLVCAVIPSGVHFVVIGFMPRSGKHRKEILAKIDDRYRDIAVVLYEAPHRLRDTLSDLASLSQQPRTLCLAREVTKKHEEILHFSSALDASKRYSLDCDNPQIENEHESEPEVEDNCSSQVQQLRDVNRGESEGPELRGEFTIVLGPKVESHAIPTGEGCERAEFRNTNVNLDTLIAEMIRSGVPVSSVSRLIASASDLSRKQIYSYALQKSTQLRDDFSARHT